ncbi:hypothetical protein [Sporomusa aerivorans]|uniref:hypothetical protein n=1 Tax=Sporomusa aerivorans TaxID=204936 RepID=UPI00352A58AD
MKFYHGTSIYHGMSIIKDGRIKKTTEDNTIYQDVPEEYKTTPGYVYLTTSDNQAFRWGKKALFHMLHYKKTTMESELSEAEKLGIYIFEVDIPDISVLEPDIDECDLRVKTRRIDRCKICTLDNCIDRIGSVRFKHDLFIGKEINRLKVMSTMTMNDKFMLLKDWSNIVTS